MPAFDAEATLSRDEAEALQRVGTQQVETSDRLPYPVKQVGGADVAYDLGSDWLMAAAVLVDATTLEVVQSSTHEDRARFPYIPGLFSFREMPPLIGALRKLQRLPDLLVCDGQGIAHPRRFGLACHVGVTLDIPTIGCAKTCLIGDYSPPGEQRGDRSALIHNDEVIGAVLRTQTRVKPVFVSIGHRISLSTACDWILRLTPTYRQPEPTRHANHLANQLRHDRHRDARGPVG